MLFADKPAGIGIQASLPVDDSLLVYLNSRLPKETPLFPVDRLDRETSGPVLFAKSPEGARQITAAWAQSPARKTYLFITNHKPPPETSFLHSSRIERIANRFVSTTTAGPVPSNSAQLPTPNAKTEFQLVLSAHGFQLWQAKTSVLNDETKAEQADYPHQVRLHARDVGLPILGDTLYGGGNFPVFCLHLKALDFIYNNEAIHNEPPVPLWFEDLGLLRNSQLCKWLAAIDRRLRILRTLSALKASEAPVELTALETIRMIHTEGDQLRLDQLGPVISASWFGERMPAEKDWDSIRTLFRLQNWPEWYLQLRGNRGQTPNEEPIIKSREDLPTRWQACENGVRYEFRGDAGLSPGLFLDQRVNRDWVRRHARGLAVLNLFSYTGGFSVCAALGGAQKTISVDVSKTFLEWTKVNFALNGLELAQHEFRAIDSRTYLGWAAKKGLHFDLLICDPPSFGRSPDGIFRIETDFEPLLESLWQVCAPKGRILFSSNYESWTLEDFTRRANLWAQKRAGKNRGAAKSLASGTPVLLPTPHPDWDFELPRSSGAKLTGAQRTMKSFFISRE